MKRRLFARTASLVLPIILAIVGCSSDSSSQAPQTGSACSSAATCYGGVDAAAVHGDVVCLTQLQDGYCSHTCQSDGDCCAVGGECGAGIKEVCAPLQSAAQTYCFVSCETADIPSSAGTTDPNAYCQKVASAGFTCRSTGGGSNNRKFCGL